MSMLNRIGNIAVVGAEFVGALAIVVGAAMIYAPAGFIAAGSALLLSAWAVERRMASAST